jgi:hypothetical protein
LGNWSGRNAKLLFLFFWNYECFCTFTRWKRNWLQSLIKAINLLLKTIWILQAYIFYEVRRLIIFFCLQFLHKFCKLSQS